MSVDFMTIYIYLCRLDVLKQQDSFPWLICVPPDFKLLLLCTQNYILFAYRQKPLEAVADKVLHAAYNVLTGNEQFRVMAGAGAKTRDTPARVTDFVATDEYVGGIFDNHSRGSVSSPANRARSSKVASVNSS
jgi:hypothetical protein